MRCALTGEHGHFSFAVHSNGVVPSRQWKNPVQMIALDPELQLAGLVSGVLANFEHRDYDYFHGDGAGRSLEP
jgi:hypothetical protein